MSNLSADLNYSDPASTARKHPWPYRLTNALVVYKGSALGLNPSTGLAVKWVDTATYLWLGITSIGATGNTSADEPVVAQIHEGITIKRLTVTGGTAITDMKSLVYLGSDNPDDVTLTPTTNVKAVGEVVRWYSGTTVDVRFFTPEEYRTQGVTADITTLTDSTGDSGTHDDTLADGSTVAAAFTDNTTGTTTTTLAAGAGTYLLSIPFALAGITSGVDIMTDVTIGHKFKILSMKWVTTTVASTASKNATITCEIGATPVTSLTITLDSDTSSTTTLGGATEVDATGANTGSASATVSLIAGTVTAFSEGSGCIVLEIQNMDTADAFAGLVTQANNLRTDNLVQNQNDSDLAQKVIEILAQLNIN